MPAVVPHLIAHLGSPLRDTIFVADAMGAGRDYGGWGVVAADIEHALALQSFHLAHHPGKAVCDFTGDYAGERDSSIAFLRKVPFTRLPPTLFDPAKTTWEDVAAGRWRFTRSYHAGTSASRGACDAGSRSLPSVPLHQSSLVGGQHGHGRVHVAREEPFAALNYPCRQRCAATMAARVTLVQPWTETSLMPADEISRYGFKMQRPSTTGTTPDGQSPGVHIDTSPEIAPAFRGVVGGA